MPTVNATTVTFAETSEDTGKDQRSSRGGYSRISFVVRFSNSFQINEN